MDETYSLLVDNKVSNQGRRKESPFRGISESRLLATVQRLEIRIHSGMLMNKKNCFAIDLVTAGAAGHGIATRLIRLLN
jgi:hypothetical protein